MRDFAAAPDKLAQYLRKNCSTTEMDLSNLGVVRYWDKRWLAVPEVKEKPQAGVTACFNATMLQAFDRYAM